MGGASSGPSELTNQKWLFSRADVKTQAPSGAFRLRVKTGSTSKGRKKKKTFDTIKNVNIKVVT